MSYYGVIFPEFWTGTTGRALREHGGKDAQLLALYLVSNRHTNMIGLYKLLPDDIRHETGLGVKAIDRGFAAAQSTDFARFDPASSYVWVVQMARFRLNLKAGETLAAGDLRVKGAKRLYQVIDPNPFLSEFFDVNHQMLHLDRRRQMTKLVGSSKQHPHRSPL